MENSLRFVLLLIGCLIVMGIAWDVWRARRRPAKQKHSSTESVLTNGVARANSVTSVAKKIKIEPAFEHSRQPNTLPKLPREFQNKMQEQDVLDEIMQDDQDILMQFNAVPQSKSSTDNINIMPRPFQKRTQSNFQKNSQNRLENIVVLNLLARQPGVFWGKKLWEAFKSVDLHLGEKDIFHRHTHSDGTGNIVFSVASAVEPGCFPVDKLDNFTTPGICLFYQKDHQKNQNVAAFELMLRTAKQLQKTLDGELKDENRKIITMQRIDAYREQVRDD